LPQAPQLLLSVEVATQRPAQSVVPLGHWHRPAEHTCPPVHTIPQAPQLLGSELTSTQRVAQ
jgi:hypothetical protein